jgi:hypothetical protein
MSVMRKLNKKGGGSGLVRKEATAAISWRVRSDLAPQSLQCGDKFDTIAVVACCACVDSGLCRGRERQSFFLIGHARQAVVKIA